MKKKIFSLLLLVLCLFAVVACGGKDPKPEPEPPVKKTALEKAKDYLYAMYKATDGAATPSDYQLTAVLKVGDDEYTVEWKVNVTTGDASQVQVTLSEDGKTVTVDVDEQTAIDLAYELTAVIKDKEGKTIEQKLTHTVPKFKELTWAEYVGKAAGESLVVKGIVTALINDNCLYMQDADGGYYLYNMKSSIAESGVKVGNTIRATGSKDIYSGTHEVKDAVIEILDTTTSVPAAVDYTEIYKNATSLKDAALAEKQALLVTIKGVEITGEDAGSGYYKFKLGNLESYIRISSSVCPLSKADQDTFKAAHASHFGWTGNATGVICVYDGAFYLTPVTVDAFEYVSLPDLDDAGMVAFEKNALTFAEEIDAAGEIALAAKGSAYEAVAITWASNSELAVVSEGKLVVASLPDDETEIKITATLTSGDATDTKEFTVKLVPSRAVMTVAEVLDEMANYEASQISTTKYSVGGVVTSSSYNDSYKSYTIWLKDGDTEKAFELYSAVMAEDKDEYHAENALVGMYVECTGYLQLYVASSGAKTFEMPYLAANKSPNGQATSPTITVVAKSYDVAGVIASMAGFAEAGEIGTEFVLVTGVVSSSSYNSKYGSYTIWLTDGTNEKAFELYSVAFAKGFDDSAFQADDALKGYTVTCQGYLQLYVSSSGAKTYEMPYLAAAKSPTKADFTPSITAAFKEEQQGGEEGFYIANDEDAANIEALGADYIVDVQIVGEGFYYVGETELYINDTVFATIEDALAFAQPGQIIYVCAGLYAGDITIEGNGITIVGANFNTVLDKDSEFTAGDDTVNTIINGAITIAEGSKNITLKGLVLEGQVTLAGVAGFNASNIVFSDIKFEETFDGCLRVSGASSDIVIKNMYLDGNCSPRGIHINATVTNFALYESGTLSTNTGLYDFFRFGQGNIATAAGTVIMKDCFVLNTLESGLMDRVPAADKYIVENNYFEKVPAAIYWRTGIADGAAIEYDVIGNTFVDCGTLAGDWDVIVMTTGANTKTEVHYNIFKDNFKSNPGTNTDYVIKVRTDAGVINCADNFISEDTKDKNLNAKELTLLESEEKARELYEKYVNDSVSAEVIKASNAKVIVTADVAELAADAEYEFAGVKYVVGKTAFATIDAALAAATDDAVIYLFPGTYLLTATGTAKVTLVGSNYNVDGYAERVTPSIITLGGNVAIANPKFIANGIDFVAVETANINFLFPATGCEEFEVSYCSIYSTNPTTSYQINTFYRDSNDTTPHTVKFTHNNFTQVDQFVAWVATATEFVFESNHVELEGFGRIGSIAYNTALFRIRQLDATYVINVSIRNNYFHGALIGCPYLFEFSTGEGSKAVVSYNVFDGVGPTFIFNNSTYVQAEITAEYNLFKDCEAESFGEEAENEKERAAAWKIEDLYAKLDIICQLWCADFSKWAVNEISSIEKVDTASINSSDMVDMLKDEALTAKWLWLYTGLYEIADEDKLYDPEDSEAYESAKGFYLANINGFFSQTEHTDTNLGTVSFDFSDPANVKAVLAYFDGSIELVLPVAEEEEKEEVEITDGEQTLTINCFGFGSDDTDPVTNYFKASAQKTILYLASKDLCQLATSTYSYAYRLGINLEDGKYVVKEIIPATGTVDVQNLNYDYILFINGNYEKKAIFDLIAVGTELTFGADLTTLEEGVVEVTVKFNYVAPEEGAGQEGAGQEGGQEDTRTDWEKLVDEFVADYAKMPGGSNASAADKIDTASIDSGSMLAFLNDAAMRAKWAWLIEGVYEAAGKPEDAEDPATTETFETSKGFYLANICGFLTKTQHTDTHLKNVSVDYSDATVWAVVWAKKAN